MTTNINFINTSLSQYRYPTQSKYPPSLTPSSSLSNSSPYDCLVSEPQSLIDQIKEHYSLVSGDSLSETLNNQLSPENLSEVLKSKLSEGRALLGNVMMVPIKAVDAVDEVGKDLLKVVYQGVAWLILNNQLSAEHLSEVLKSKPSEGKSLLGNVMMVPIKMADAVNDIGNNLLAMVDWLIKIGSLAIIAVVSMVGASIYEALSTLNSTSNSTRPPVPNVA